MSATDSIPTPDTAARRGPWAEVFFSLLRSPTFLVGLGIVLFWVACALFGSLLAVSRTRIHALGNE